MPHIQRIVLITGCSDVGTGAALAVLLHDTGHKVIATTRDTSKMAEVKKLGI